MRPIHKAISAVAVGRIKQAFKQEFAPGSHLRLSGFDRAEIGEMVARLEGWEPWAKHPARLVVTTRTPWPGLPASVAMDPESTATRFRNQAEPVVFFEVDAYSDSQGLKKVWRITDRDLLTHGREGNASRGDLLTEVWRLTKPTESCPDLLTSALDETWDFVGADAAFDVRTWARFVAMICDGAGQGVLSVVDAWRLIGLHLPALLLFPDDVLSDASRTERSRRLRRNVRASRNISESADEAVLDDLRGRVDAAIFEERDGSRVPAEAAAVLKEAFRGLLGSSRDPAREGLWFRYWEQVESKKSKTKGLGDQVREQILQVAPLRIAELDETDVVGGLNAREQEAAQRFLEAPSLPDTKPLSTLVPPALLKAVMKVADPAPRVTRQPLRKLLREIYQATQERQEPGTLRLERIEKIRRTGAVQPTSEQAGASAALFAFLYGPVLRSVSEQVRGESTQFEVEGALLRAEDFGAWRACLDSDDEKVDDEPEPIEWEPLRLQLRWSDDPASKISFEWRPRDVPGYAMLARVVAWPRVARWRGAERHSFDEWLDGVFEGGTLDGVECSHLLKDKLVETYQLRQEALAAIAERGLVPDTLVAYVHRWRAQLDRLRLEFRPEGNPDPIVEEFLQLDTWDGHDGTLALLAHHPIRLRWIAAHLGQVRDLLIKALGRGLSLNEVNEDLFFDQLEQASPRAHPPVLVLESKQYVAVREVDWHEIFQLARDKSGLRRDWLSELDDQAVDAAADLIVQYIEAYPHKADGLHLLTLAPAGASASVVRTLKAVKGALGRLGGRRLELVLSVFAPVEELTQLERAIQVFDDEDRKAESEFPSIRVHWHEWDRERDLLPDLTSVSAEVDVALVPNLFGSRVEASESTEIRSNSGAAFVPCIDPTTTTSGESRDGRPMASVSRRLLPEGHDELLEFWSTVNVRQFRSKAVSGDSPDHSTDFFEFRVPFGGSAQFFSALHAKAQWVLTLDPFVGREQIEALENGPDVITVRTRVGVLGTHGLVVSSRAGREFVAARLERRLRQQLPRELASSSKLFADRVYDHARALVPGILLRALGLGRTAQEMVGLVVTRRRISEEFPVDLGESGFEAWISFDEHTDWFGTNRTRSDLVRLVGRYAEGKLALDVLVVEAKFREHIDMGRAEEQISQSIGLLRDALTIDQQKPDADLWRRVIVDGIRRLTKGGRHRFAREALRVVWMNRPLVDLPTVIRDSLIQGSYQQPRMSGVLCTLPAADALDGADTTPIGFRWIRTTVAEIGRLLERLDELDDRRDMPRPVRTNPADSIVSPVVPPAKAAGSQAHVGGDPAITVPGTITQEGSDGIGASRTPVGNETRLKERLQRLIGVLGAHGVNATPDREESAAEGPGFYVFRVRLPKGVTPKAVHKLSEEIQYGLQLPAGFLPRSYTDRGAVVVEVPKEEAERITIFAKDLWRDATWPADHLFAPIGVDARFRPVGIDFSSSKSPHLLIGGMTGGGKSVALETILRGLIQRYPVSQLRLLIVDPKGTEFAALEGDPHIAGKIGMDAEDAISVLEQAVEEMTRRYAAMKAKSVRDIVSYNSGLSEGERLPWHLIVLDEYADLTSEKDSKKDIERLVQQIAQKARAAGIHLIVATQKPSVEVISSTTRSNLGAQLALRVKNSTDSRVIMDDTGAESLAGNGDAFLRFSGAEPTRVQCALYRD